MAKKKATKKTATKNNDKSLWSGNDLILLGTRQKHRNPRVKCVAE